MRLRSSGKTRIHDLMQLQIRPSDPLIVDRWLDVAYVTLWFVYGLWGVSSLVVGLPTISLFAPNWYQAIWSGIIGSLSITASILAALVFFKTRWMRQITKKRAEKMVVTVLCAFVGVYPFLLFLRAGQGELNIVGPSSVLAFSYLIFPILRTHILRKRIRAIKEVVSVASGANRTL